MITNDSRDGKDYLFRFRYREQGGHTHVRVFAGSGAASSDWSMGCCGALVFRNDEWKAFVDEVMRNPLAAGMGSRHISFVEDYEEEQG